jgi:hypothetical protein
MIRPHVILVNIKSKIETTIQTFTQDKKKMFAYHQDSLSKRLSTILRCPMPLKDSDFIIAFDTTMTLLGEGALTYKDISDLYFFQRNKDKEDT